MDNRTIVKVQVPIKMLHEETGEVTVPSLYSAPALVYNQSMTRSTLGQPVSRHVRDALNENRKGYFYAIYDDDDEAWIIQERAPEQPW